MTHIPDEAVRAAYSASYGKIGFAIGKNHSEVMRAALTAALPYLLPVDVAAVRKQAFEEAAKTLDAWGDIYGDNAAACVRALSAEPSQGEQWQQGGGE